MTTDEARNLFVDALAEIAPEVAGEEIDPARSLREQVDLDSMDFLSLVTTLSEQIGIDIPESDYRSLETVDAATAYLSSAT